MIHTAISIKVVPEQSRKVEYEREKLAGRDDLKNKQNLVSIGIRIRDLYS